MTKEKLTEAHVDTTKSQKEDDTPQLPHERDESSASQESEPREVMKQAHRDIESGQVDTDLHGIRGVEAIKNPAGAPAQKSAGEKIAPPEAAKSTADDK